LFSTYILKNIKGLQHIDYAMDLYNGKPLMLPLEFKEYGAAYGPIRLSAPPESLVYKHLVHSTSDFNFIKDKISVFLVRDPRDILISAYYSFGFTHGFSEVEEIKERQQLRRETIKNKSLEEYVLESAEAQNANFKTLYDLSKQSTRSVVLKYEDMIENFDYFISEFSKHINVSDAVKAEIYKRSRPKQKEDVNSHRRSGGVAGFRDKLDEETLLSLNKILKDTLQQFDYKL
jgi:hypothetical protein